MNKTFYEKVLQYGIIVVEVFHSQELCPRCPYRDLLSLRRMASRSEVSPINDLHSEHLQIYPLQPKPKDMA